MHISLTAGEDYNVTQQSLVIPAGSTSSSYSIDIINDMIHENDETFNITITFLPSCLSIIFDHNVSTVIILDDEGMKIIKWNDWLLSLYVAPSTCITFNQSAYTANEDDGFVTIVLTLSNPSTTDITVQVSSTNGSAIGEYVGEEYDIILWCNRRRCWLQFWTIQCYICSWKYQCFIQYYYCYW